MSRTFIPGDIGFPPGQKYTSIEKQRSPEVAIVPTCFVSGGTKFDGDKARMDLLDPEFLEGVAQVLTFGAQKYAPNNWRKGIAYSRLIAATYRHLGAINKGEDIDPESGLPHVYHIGCCIMFLANHMKHKPALDDRFKYE